MILGGQDSQSWTQSFDGDVKLCFIINNIPLYWQESMAVVMEFSISWSNANYSSSLKYSLRLI